MAVTITPNTELSDKLVKVSVDAGVVIMEIYNAASGIETDTKSDDSPVTLADQKAEDIILAVLKEVAPGVPVLAEESVAAGNIPDVGDEFFLVDPLDGTKEFIKKGTDFTVNIALIQNGRPVMGVVYAPARSHIWVAEGPATAWEAEVAPGGDVPAAADRKPMKIRPLPEAGVTAVASKSHRTPETDEFLGKFKVAELVSMGSSLKFCMIAAGDADLYPRLGRTMEWDTGAAHAVISAAGGRVLTLEGIDLTYGKKERGYDNPHFVVYGDVEPPKA
ncbi:3'(2'),5'-bisphosphate nucleotidase CysQ [Ponticaulis sp.]|uniref:3'(2'),5'-bisphosphate nucleotidase CysQ n=1 Tax=Ponticaulis sp. TaxID=2020902 RepID=UPI000B664FA9|nr:3'(2'),5'-bisphosphate nucleotidase CysQ [Ponticaulis sp.]MAI90099.1 3'(2'),5'-bisphosphate nucleotidase [Ponticaulis sp.]OUX99754.1 MAG: 3'(2'),5'-bisphosphate nucleotidase [Hyphomonadaceae bacterium TMED5]|tara:strand:+ start:58826 stop:59653 length:828 start_codon:yes stop_codon:yes gene_type:complete